MSRMNFLVQRLKDGRWGAFLYKDGKHHGIKRNGDLSSDGMSRMQKMSTAERAAARCYEIRHSEGQEFHLTVYEG